MQKHKLLITLDSIEQCAENFIDLVGKNKKFAFFGGMGVGKTTFITALCNKLGAIDNVSSPTFAIVNEYQTGSDALIYHFDFYRIKNSEELYDIGFEEYLDEYNWCFIEWPEKAEELIPDDFIAVTLTANENGVRELGLKC